MKVAVPREQMPRRPAPVEETANPYGGGYGGGYGGYGGGELSPGYGGGYGGGGYGGYGHDSARSVVMPSYAFDTYAPEPVMMGMPGAGYSGMRRSGMPPYMAAGGPAVGNMRVDMAYATAAHAAAAQGVPVRAGIVPDGGTPAAPPGAPPGSFIAPAVYSPSPMGMFTNPIPYAPMAGAMPYLPAAAGVPGSGVLPRGPPPGGWGPQSPASQQQPTQQPPPQQQQQQQPPQEPPPSSQPQESQ